MAKVILGMTMSLDGFINDRNGRVDALYFDLVTWRETEVGKESIQNTGTVVMGRNSYAMADDPDWFAGNYEYQVPIFVLTHHVPKKKPKEIEPLTFTFVTDGFESAVHQAKEAAGDKEVNIIGAAGFILERTSAESGWKTVKPRERNYSPEFSAALKRFNDSHVFFTCADGKYILKSN